MATLAQMYNGIYGPADTSLPPIPAQVPVMAPAPPSPPQMPTPSIQQLYEGIYGPATNAWDAQRNGMSPAGAAPPSPPSPPQAPRGLTTDLGSVGWGAFANMFPSTSRTRTEQAAPVQPSGYGPNSRPKDNERLLPSSNVTPGALTSVFAGPTTRVVQSVPFTNVAQSAAGVPLPRARPNTTGVIATYPTTGLGQQFAPPQSSGGLRVVVNGANAIQPQRVAPTPAPLSQRPASSFGGASSGNAFGATGYTPPAGLSAVDALRSQGYSPSDAYAMANQQSRQSAIANSSNPSGNSVRASLASRFGFD